ncbi:hypothetical protein HY621_01135 [Candidatus Uhrbacteria bacterium]|nr:hypothetical protein [Candidatus Uhrbacteria bacterium]
MLSKRTNILFSNEMWEELNTLAKERKSSIGEIVRSAIEDVYLSERKRVLFQNAVRAIIHARPKSEKEIDYKELINEGRNE